MPNLLNITNTQLIHTLLFFTVLVLFFASYAIYYYISRHKQKLNLETEQVYDENGILIKNNVEFDAKDKNKSLLIILLYFFIFFVFASIIQSIVLKVYILINNINPETLNPTHPLYEEVYAQVSADLNPILQVIIYGLCIAVLLPLGHKWIIKDRKGILNKKTPVNILTYIAAIFLVNIVASQLLVIIGADNLSSNQEALNDIFASGPFGLISTIIITTFCAPIVEELVFRKGIFTLCGFNTKKAIVISSITFGLLHVISPTFEQIFLLTSGTSNIYTILLELVQIVPYAAMGFVLCVAYEKSNQNIAFNILLHAVYNSLSVIILLTQL